MLLMVSESESAFALCFIFEGALRGYVSSLLVSDNCSGSGEAAGEETERVHYRKRV